MIAVVTPVDRHVGDRHFRVGPAMRGEAGGADSPHRGARLGMCPASLPCVHLGFKSRCWECHSVLQSEDGQMCFYAGKGSVGISVIGWQLCAVLQGPAPARRDTPICTTLTNTGAALLVPDMYGQE